MTAHFPARPGAPIACDMSTAADTPAERLAEYEALFERAVLQRRRRPGALVLTFRDGPGVREAVEDLARREAACCPFLDLRVAAAAGEVTWTIAGDDRPGVDAILDELATLPRVGVRSVAWRHASPARR